MKKSIIFTLLFSLTTIIASAHPGTCCPLYIIDKHPYLNFNNLKAEEIKSIDVCIYNYNIVSFFNENEPEAGSCASVLESNTNSLFLKIENDSKLEASKRAIYIINQEVITIEDIQTLINNKELNQISAFLIIDNCESLQTQLDVDVTNGLVIIQTKSE